MKLRRHVAATFWSVFLASALCALAQTNRPILIGEGRNQITAEIIEVVSQLTRSARGEGTNVWMLEGIAYGDGKKELFAIQVLFAPTNSSERILRCRGIYCHQAVLNPPHEDIIPYIRFGNWWADEHRTHEYCWIVPNGQKIITNQPVGERFSIAEKLTDADLLALYDATKISTKNATILNFQTERDSSHVRVMTVGGGLSDGSHNWMLLFEKSGGAWKETSKGRWIE